ncbi:MAG: flagellar export chaperone FliS [Gammaproteobacteria bacterium]
MNMRAQGALNSYKAVGVQGSVTEATPHRLIQILMEGAIDRLNSAKGCSERHEHGQRSQLISQAASIIGGLAASLDMERGGEIAVNLAELYSYMLRKLTSVQMSGDVAGIDEVIDLVSELKAGWDAIPASFHTRTQATP